MMTTTVPFYEILMLLCYTSSTAEAVITITGNCSGTYDVRAHEITSPNYPNNYKNNDNCIWYIKAPIHYNIEIVFEDFILEYTHDCSNDLLAIYDYYDGGNFSWIGTFCSTSHPGRISSTSNTLMLRFKTSRYHYYKGFKISYTAQECNGKIKIIDCNASSSFSTLQSCEQAFDGNTHTSWSVSSSNEHPWIQLRYAKDILIQRIEVVQADYEDYRFKDIVIELSNGMLHKHELKNQAISQTILLPGDNISNYIIIRGMNSPRGTLYFNRIREIDLYGCRSIDCKWSAYKPISNCSLKCGSTSLILHRKITQNALYGGQNCTGNHTMIKGCDFKACPWHIAIGSGGTVLGALLIILSYFLIKKKSDTTTCHTYRYANETNTRDDADYDGLCFKSSTENNDTISKQEVGITQNPYYNKEQNIDSLTIEMVNTSERMSNVENVTVTENPYYGSI